MAEVSAPGVLAVVIADWTRWTHVLTNLSLLSWYLKAGEGSGGISVWGWWAAAGVWEPQGSWVLWSSQGELRPSVYSPSAKLSSKHSSAEAAFQRPSAEGQGQL